MVLGDVPSLHFFNGTSIRFRGACDWSSPAIAAFYSKVQDGNMHYVIVNVKYVGFISGAHKWFLKISVDGKPYVSYGMQTSGSAGPITTGGSPQVTVTGTPADSYVDEVIRPEQTREKLVRALEMLRDKRQENPARKHGNIPL